MDLSSSEQQKTEMDATKRKEIIKKIDARLVAINPYVLMWQSGDFRMLYWNRFGTPKSVLSKFGDESDALELLVGLTPTRSKALDDAQQKRQHRPSEAAGRGPLSGMTTYVLRRLLLMIPTMLGITIICFLLCQLSSQAARLEQQRISQHSPCGRGARRHWRAKEIPQEEIRILQVQFDFDKPIHVRYFLWLKKACTFRFWHVACPEHVGRCLQVIAVEVSALPLFCDLTSFIIYRIWFPSRLGVHKAMTHGKAFPTRPAPADGVLPPGM